MSLAVKAARKKADGAVDPSLLLAWYDRHRRVLPWRARKGERADPYRVWLSEIMLQQTTVKAVAPFYARFLERFPTVTQLAAAPLDEVLSLWAGLGYYARARNLHALARRVTDRGRDASAVLPADAEALRTLPGIGAYTAGAVSSFAYERRAELVDTNVARVVKRVFAPDADLKTGAGQKHVWRIARELLPRTGSATWTHNQALMELGALVCTARVARCEQCPVRRLCATGGE
jgi:A/G-specific adenine glycosylase